MASACSNLADFALAGRRASLVGSGPAAARSWTSSARLSLGPDPFQGRIDPVGLPAGRYALDTPMSLFASLVFEQSYGGVEGDSASSAELYALLSALSERRFARIWR